ncbi:MAG: class I SAM-dependent methyltransferase [Pyrinomonadaceae bacterium]
MLPNDDPDPAYEDLPYPSMTIQDTHPDHLAVMARFHDLVPRSPEKCRVLELGCGNGSNLNWMASTLPASEFVGVDLSKVHIDEACETHSKLGIGNAEFYEQNVLEIDEQEFGEFDYIIAHGLFSWVPEDVREKILDLYGKLLAPNGVGYISYNVLPGFYRRRLMRESMLFHIRDVAKPSEMVGKAKAFAQFLSENTFGSPLYSVLLKSEFEGMAGRDESNIYHDDLFTFNNPYYFSDFIASAGKMRTSVSFRSRKADFHAG